MEEKLIEGLGLAELWKAIPAMKLTQIVGMSFVLSLVMFVFILWIFRKQVMKFISKKLDNNESIIQDFWSEEGINIRKTPSKLSLVKADAKEYQKVLLNLISSLRSDKVSGKQFVINMEETTYMSNDAKNMFKELASNSIKLNIVRLVYVIPQPNKNINNMDKYYSELMELCKKYDAPGSWAVKYSSNKKKFYEV